MMIRFLGPVGRVTGSCYWLSDAALDLEFLVDCGMVQGEPDERRWNHGPFAFDPRRLRFVLLTHAHVDHSGLIPRLYHEGFDGPVYCTPETRDLARLLLKDAARQKDAAFNESDVARIRWKAIDHLNTCQPVHRDVFVRTYRAAHVLGAVSFQVLWGPKPVLGAPNEQRRMTFSGDLGGNVEGREFLPLLRHRMNPDPADFVVVESTYGDRVRPAGEEDFEARLDRLRAAVDEAVIHRGGILVLPCFGVDRTQEILLDLHLLFWRQLDRYGDVPVYLHAPLAARANEVYARGLRRKARTRRGELRPLWLSKVIYAALGRDPENLADETFIEAVLATVFAKAAEAAVGMATCGLPRLHHIIDQPPTDVIGLQPHPGILVTGGGMCEGGPIVAYLDTLLRRDTTTLLFSGYAGRSTVAGQLLDVADVSVQDRARLGEEIRWTLREGSEHVMPTGAIRASIGRLTGYSAHADQASLLGWLFHEFDGQPRAAGRTVFLTHGNETARRALAAAVEDKVASGIFGPVSVIAPASTDGEYDLDRGAWKADLDEPFATADDVGGLRARIVWLEDQLVRARRRTG